jgi:hypothetical protein
MKKWMKDECVICGATEDLTQDHILPKWFALGVVNLGFRVRTSNFPEKYRKIPKYQSLCGKCNRLKSGVIDYSNPRVRAYMKQLAENILDIIKIHEEPITNNH